MKRQRFWALPWPCLCFLICIASCKTIQNATSEPTAYRIQFTVQSIKEGEIHALISGVQAHDIDIESTNGTLTMVSMLVPGEGQVDAFKQRLNDYPQTIYNLKINKE